VAIISTRATWTLCHNKICKSQMGNLFSRFVQALFIERKKIVCPSTNKIQICNIWRTQTPSLKHITTPTLSTQMSTRQRSIFSWTAIDAVWSSWEVDGSDANWPSEFVFITKSLARMAAEDALTDVLEGSRSSPPLKHMTINFWRK